MKKFLSVFMVILLCVMAFSSCGKTKDDPLALAKFFDEKDYYVELAIDDEDIGDCADMFEVRAKGIEYILFAAPDDGEDDEKAGVFIFCESKDVAEKVFEDLEEFIEDDEDFSEDVVRGIVERSGKLVFVGCEDTWEDWQ